MIVLPAGMRTPKLVKLKLQPMPKITSALLRNSATALEWERLAEPRLNGCVSGKALLPLSVVVTGASSSSANSFSASHALA